MNWRWSGSKKARPVSRSLKNRKSNSLTSIPLTKRRLRRNNCSCAVKSRRRRDQAVLRKLKRSRNNLPRKLCGYGKIAKRRRGNSAPILASRLNGRFRSLRVGLFPRRQIRVEEAEHMRVIDHADTFLFLQI